MVAPLPILSVLPPREGFGPEAYGAVSLCVRDFALHSRYREQVHVAGLVDVPPFEGVHYHLLSLDRRRWESQTEAYARAVAALARRIGARLIEVQNRPSLLLRLRRHVPDIALALHLHNDPQEMKGARFAYQRRRLLKEAAAIYCVSDYIRTRLLAGCKGKEERCHLVYNGILRLPFEEHRERVVLYAGRMTPNKGVLEFARALAIALPQLPGWRGVVMGGSRHQISAEMTDYERAVYEVIQAIGPQAHFAGFTPHAEILEAYRSAEVAVVPSLWEEPFGRTALEAMAGGAALITSARGGLAEVVGNAAYLAEPHAETLAEAIICLARDDMQRAALQRAGYARADGFSAAACAEMLDAARESIDLGAHPAFTAPNTINRLD